ncbi:hypothetical protein BCE75_107199 [Isoptericola sp. CG 20/1183]|uniref:Uncharacterized protein n=1 Tax=Isoptericola halotolerans TaxID=300560 RepID=A0ABX5ECZ9_9MICO|nr:hypothetical protein BCL65_107199 [Isoptericola halotolerans]PRZ06279.1 hypothetical protein BCE75_107199 [Isoptericola sp. CG 20/1183]
MADLVVDTAMFPDLVQGTTGDIVGHTTLLARDVPPWGR